MSDLAPVRWLHNPRDRAWTRAAASPAARQFHRSLDGYAPTPLVGLPALARELGVGRVLVKDESARLGLPAFKALGASWAVSRVLAEHDDSDSDSDSDEPVALVTATDGNHGRAVARFARLMGHPARIVVPSGVHPAAVAAIEDEGADVVRVDGTYDEAVATAAGLAERTGALLVQDTAWAGYEAVPAMIVEGYTTLFAEVDDALAECGPGTAGLVPDLVVVPTGVGSLLHAALIHYRAESHPTATTGTAVVSVEPESAACVLASLRAGRSVTVDTGETIMAGLNCGTVSAQAWPDIARGVDGSVAVSDSAVVAAMHDLDALGVRAGPCGAASLAGARDMLTGPAAATRRNALGIGSDSVVVLLVTEGADANPLPHASNPLTQET